MKGEGGKETPSLAAAESSLMGIGGECGPKAAALLATSDGSGWEKSGRT